MFFPFHHIHPITSLATIRLAPLTEARLVSPYGVRMSLWLVCKFTADHELQTTAMMNRANDGFPLRHSVRASLKNEQTLLK